MRRLTATLLLLTSVALDAQQQPPVFRAATDLVEVDVIVRDRDGKFVPDLSAGDFIVEENGQPQSIQAFYVRVGGVTTAPSDSASTAATELAGAAAQPPRALVVVFDDEHLTAAGFRRAQAAAETLFAEEFHARDIGGVISAGRMANNRLSSDREELLRAVRNAKPRGGANAALLELQRWPRMNESELFAVARGVNDVLEEVVRRACYDDPGQCRPPAGPEYARTMIQHKTRDLSASTRAQANNTLHTMTRLFSGLAPFDRRKIVLMISEGFLTEDSLPLLRDSAAAAAQADVRVYAVDAKGLDTHRMGEHLRGETAGNNESLGNLLNVESDSGALSSLGVDSGGAYLRNLNDLNRAIRLIAEDSANHYVVAFKPSTPQDGKFHPIRVRVTREGVSVRARRGYLAVAKTPPVTSTSPATTDATDVANLKPVVAAEAPPDKGASASAPDTTATATSPAEPAAVVRTRPGAAENAQRLAPSGAADSDAAEGWAAFQRGDVDTAYARLSTAANRTAAQPWVHYTLGISSYAIGRFKEAADAWERVRGAAPEFEPAYFDLIDAYLQQRDFDRATRVARTALERWPRDPEIYQALGVVQTVRGSLDDAVKSFREALTIAPDDANTYFNLGKAMELRYFKSRRYVDQLRRWVSNEADRTEAIDNYRRHIELKGVYADSARAGLQRLEWVSRPK
jgi:VWFA-related protein